MVKYTIEREIAVIEDKGRETIELNYIKWGNNPAKYDLRRWTDEGEPLKGITLTEEGLEELYWAISEELGYGSEEEQDDDFDNEYEDEEDEYSDEDEEDDEEEDIDDDTFPIDYRSFFVLQSMDECEQDGHDYCNVIATVPVMIDDEFNDIEFPAIYCKDCNIYYITEEVYYHIKGMGKVLCQILTEDEYHRYLAGSDFSNLSPKGPLYLLGYNVARDRNGDDILTSSERKHLLDWIIDNGIMKKKKVIFYLDLFVKKNQGRTNMSLAVQKWREDKEYLTGIKSDGKNAPPMGVARIVV